MPKTIEDLLILPGVGPKMGFLCLQAAWGIQVGIGVDTHVNIASTSLTFNILIFRISGSSHHK